MFQESETIAFTKMFLSKPNQGVISTNINKRGNRKTYH